MTIISHCEISFLLVWSMILACIEFTFLNFNAATKREIPSITVEIPIQIHAKVLASFLSDTAITIAKINKRHHSHTIPHRNDWVSLLFSPKIISITHLIKAQIAKIQIIIVHTSWDHEKISQNQIRVNKKPPIQSNQTNPLFLFLKALTIADIPDVNKKNHKIISMNFQNIPGANIVIIQKTVITMDNPIIREYDQDCACLPVSIDSLIYKK